MSAPIRSPAPLISQPGASRRRPGVIDVVDDAGTVVGAGTVVADTGAGRDKMVVVKSSDQGVQATKDGINNVTSKPALGGFGRLNQIPSLIACSGSWLTGNCTSPLRWGSSRSKVETVEHRHRLITNFVADIGSHHHNQVEAPANLPKRQPEESPDVGTLILINAFERVS